MIKKQFTNPEAGIENDPKMQTFDWVDWKTAKWNNWVADDHAVLMFVQQEDQLLLIHKKRGLGAGKVNAPGGKLEDGEDYKAAAIRECQEEVGVTPLLPKKVGELYFRFADGYNLYGEVFWSFEFRGTPVETEEALPFWCPISDIPYEKMWRDDHIWLPLVLEGYGIKGWFDFDGDTMTSGRVEFAQR